MFKQATRQPTCAVTALLIALNLSPVAMASQAIPSLRQVDEGPRRPDFVAFRQELRQIIARRDTAALLRVVHPQIRSSLGGDDGIDGFKRQLEGKETDVWRELDAVLALGGTFQSPDTFVAPYVFSRWPEQLDAFEHVAVIGSGVRIREEPSLGAAIVTAVSYGILKRGPEGYSDGPWTSVQLPDGRAGFMASSLVRSPVDYRAFFKLEDGRWRMIFFAAGD